MIVKEEMKALETVPSDRTEPQSLPSPESNRIRLIRSIEENVKELVDMIYLIEDTSFLAELEAKITKLEEELSAELREQHGLPPTTKVNPLSKWKSRKQKRPSEKRNFN